MNAGTIAVLDPIDEPLESWARSPGETPVLDVHETQDRFDGTPVQQGMAAGTVSDTDQQVFIDGTAVDVESAEIHPVVATEWAADVTGAGLVAAASVYETGGDYDFPFDLMTHNLGTAVERVEIDTESLASAWESSDSLRGTWMRATRDDEGDFSVHYGDVPDDVDPSAGVGFETAWDGTVMQGVIWPSGYVAIYKDVPSAVFLDFVADEILPFAEVPEDDDGFGNQATFGGSNGR